MINKVILGGLVLICISGICCGCINKKEINSIVDIAYDNNDSEYEIYVLENNLYVTYVVITGNYYGGNVLLLRKSVLDMPMRINEYSSLYPDSEIDRYLNREYLLLKYR